jgi:hypothetical protein
MSDFIREVDEDYRRERAMRFVSRYQVLIAIAVVGIIVGAGVWRFWTDKQLSLAEEANSRYDSAVALAKQDKDKEARSAFDAIVKDGPPGYALLARMKAVQTIEASDPDGAAKQYDAIASDDSISGAMRDAARMRGAFLRIDRDDPKAFEQRYGNFAVTSFAFHDSMRELLALAAMKRDDMPAAIRFLDEIVIDPLAPTALRNRAEAFRALASAGSAKASSKPAPQPTVHPANPADGLQPITPPPAAETPTPPAPLPAAPPVATALPTPAPPVTPAPPASATPVPEAPPAKTPDQ